MPTVSFTRHAPRTIREGLPVEELDRLTDLLTLSRPEVAALLLISERTLARRRRDGHLTQAESDRLVRYLSLVEETLTAFDGNQDAAVEWLTTPKTILNLETPLQYADTTPGLEAVRDMLGIIEFTMPA